MKQERKQNTFNVAQHVEKERRLRIIRTMLTEKRVTIEQLAESRGIKVDSAKRLAARAMALLPL